MADPTASLKITVFNLRRTHISADTLFLSVIQFFSSDVLSALNGCKD